MFGNNMYSKRYHVPHNRDSTNYYHHPQNNQFKRKTPYSNNKHSLTQQQFNHEFWCETCDRGFKTNNILEDHKKQHQKCNIDGCQFVAHPKVIIKHVQMQHSTGLYKKIAKLNNPEEIAKWREDRKKKYPTKANIEKKAQEVKEKIERGEKMGLGPIRRQKDLQNRRKKPYEHTKKHNSFLKKETPPINKQHQKNNCKMISISCDQRKLKPFPGIQLLITENNDIDPIQNISTDLIEDDEFVKEEENPQPVSASTPALCGALASLINEYGSSDDEEIDMTESNQVIKETSLLPNAPTHSAGHKKISLNCNNLRNSKENAETKCEVDDNDSGPEEIKVVKEVQSMESEKVVERRPQKHHTNRYPKDKQQNKKIIKNTKHRIPSTLLEKLLGNEIRHERNIVLQCIRHIVKNNYFDKNC